MRKLFFVCAAVLLMLSGCTLHFKATDLEADIERQRVNANKTFQLASADILK